jgi:hypothetical protein
LGFELAEIVVAFLAILIPGLGTAGFILGYSAGRMLKQFIKHLSGAGYPTHFGSAWEFEQKLKSKALQCSKMPSRSRSCPTGHPLIQLTGGQELYSPGKTGHPKFR